MSDAAAGGSGSKGWKGADYARCAPALESGISEGGQAAIRCHVMPQVGQARCSYLARYGFAPCLGRKGVRVSTPRREGRAHLSEGGAIREPRFDQLCGKP